MNKTKPKSILLALSGGVDSAVSALQLKKQGYNVIGLFMQTFRNENTNKKNGNPCKSLTKITDEKMAEIVAKTLKIKFISINSKKEYKNKVINPMISDYKKGLTPNPDIICNKLIKFPILLKKAKKLGADYIATGHYARIKKQGKNYQLLQAKDKTKDQSYFLCNLNQETLKKLIFPIGNLTKIQVRKIAEKNKLPNFNKPSTRGICFIGKTPNIKSFLEKSIKQKQGKIIDEKGKVIGTHPGTFYFTIGQKIQDNLGLKIKKPKEFAQKRYYIIKKDTKTNTLTAVPENSPLLKRKSIKISHFHLINEDEIIPKSNLKARIRHLGELHQGKLIKKKNNYEFTFKKPQEITAQGQFIVLYKGNQLIVSGKIS